MSGVKGRSGRKKMPLAILKKRGSRTDRRGEECEIDGDVILISPKEMSANMRTFYAVYQPILQKSGIMAATDSIAFESMARNYARIQALNKIIGDADSVDNLFVNEMTKFDTVKRVSAVAKLVKDYEILLWSQLREFGLTPSSRGNVSKIKTEGEDTEKLT